MKISNFEIFSVKKVRQIEVSQNVNKLSRVFSLNLLGHTLYTSNCWIENDAMYSFFLALLLFLSICIFGGACWDRDWLLYPNYNYVSWSYAFAVFSTLGHIIATFFMFVDCGKAKERKEKNKALIMQMHPQAYSSTTSSYHQGLGYI